MIEELQKEIVELKAENNLLKSQLDEAKDEIHRHEVDLAECQSIINSLEDDLSSEDVIDRPKGFMDNEKLEFLLNNINNISIQQLENLIK